MLSFSIFNFRYIIFSMKSPLYLFFNLFNKNPILENIRSAYPLVAGIYSNSKAIIVSYGYIT
jgi:hypothetical protein